MAPWEASPAPGKDSMGMDMVPVYEDEADTSSIISIDPVTVQNMGIRTALVVKGPLRRVIRTVGAIDFDETTLVDVTTKFKGWIEELRKTKQVRKTLSVNAPIDGIVVEKRVVAGQMVEAGEKLCRLADLALV